MTSGIECVRIDEGDDTAEVASAFQLSEDRIGAGFLSPARFEQLLRQRTAELVHPYLRLVVSAPLILCRLAVAISSSRGRQPHSPVDRVGSSMRLTKVF